MIVKEKKEKRLHTWQEGGTFGRGRGNYGTGNRILCKPIPITEKRPLIPLTLTFLDPCALNHPREVTPRALSLRVVLLEGTLPLPNLNARKIGAGIIQGVRKSFHNETTTG